MAFSKVIWEIPMNKLTLKGVLYRLSGQFFLVFLLKSYARSITQWRFGPIVSL